MYDGEARGSRLLDRSRLPPEVQRHVLIGTGQSLEYEKVKDTLLFQFPEHKPAPQTYHYGQHNQQQNNTGAPPWGKGGWRKPSGPGKGRGGKGKDKNGKSYHQTWVTDTITGTDNYTNDEPYGDMPIIPEGEDDGAEDPNDKSDYPDEPAENDEEADAGNFDDFDPQQMGEVLTVTARKLSAMVQGRKFTGHPRRSIEEGFPLCSMRPTRPLERGRHLSCLFAENIVRRQGQRQVPQGR